MAFVPKEWKDRLVEFAGRRKLTNVSTGEEIIVDVARNEGTVSQEGDAFSAANMNNLEQRIKDGFDKVDTNIGGNILSYNESEDAYYIQHGADSVPKKLGSGSIFRLSPTPYSYGGNVNKAFTIDISNVYSDYKNITVDNIIVSLDKWGGNDSFVNPVISYDATSGIIDVKAGSNIYIDGDCKVGIIL